MAQILSLARLREAKMTHRSAFRQLVSNALMNDLTQKKKILQSFGNPTATIVDGLHGADGDTDYLMLMFAGSGPLEAFSFGFAIRSNEAHTSINAEIFVLDGTTALLSKVVSTIAISDYSKSWLVKSYSDALELIAPQPALEDSTETARA